MLREGQFEPTESLDEDLYSKFEELNFADYELLVPDKKSTEDQKRIFLDGGARNPKLIYPKLEMDRLSSLEEKLLALKEETKLEKPREKYVEHMEEPDLVKQVYRWKINEKIAQVRMLKSSVKGDMRSFGRYSEFVYGKPSKEIFDFIVNKTQDKMRQHKFSNAALELADVLPEKEDATLQEPTQEEFGRASEVLLQRLEQLIKIKDGKGAYSADEISLAFDEALKELKADGWKVEIDRESGRSAISVSQDTKTVNIPESKYLLGPALKKLIAHEIGTHVSRRLSGERSRLKLLGLGLDRYDKGEEGVATLAEQVVEGDAEGFTRQALYLAISLASGVDGERRDFRDVYDIMYKYYSLQKEDGNFANEKPEELAWTTCVRVFRGTDCSSSTCFTKDLIYLEGNIGVWNVVRTDEDELFRFSVGKYDPNNSRHIMILDMLGISNEDLNNLEENESTSGKES